MPHSIGHGRIDDVNSILIEKHVLMTSTVAVCWLVSFVTQSTEELAEIAGRHLMGDRCSYPAPQPCGERLGEGSAAWFLILRNDRSHIQSVLYDRRIKIEGPYSRTRFQKSPHPNPLPARPGRGNMKLSQIEFASKSDLAPQIIVTIGKVLQVCEIDSIVMDWKADMTNGQSTGRILSSC